MDVDFSELDDWLGTLENLQSSLITTDKEAVPITTPPQTTVDPAPEPAIVIRDKTDLSNQHTIQSIRLSFNEVHKKNPNTGDDLENLLNAMKLEGEAGPHTNGNHSTGKSQPEPGGNFHSTASIDSGIHDARLSPKPISSSSSKSSPQSNVCNMGYTEHVPDYPLTEQGFVLPPYPAHKYDLPPVEQTPLIPLSGFTPPCVTNYSGYALPTSPPHQPLHTSPPATSHIIPPLSPTMSSSAFLKENSFPSPSFNHSISLPSDFVAPPLSPMLHNHLPHSPNSHPFRENASFPSPALSLKSTLKQCGVTPLKSDLLSQRRLQTNVEHSPRPIRHEDAFPTSPEVGGNPIKYGVYSPIPGVQRNNLGNVANNSWQNSSETLNNECGKYGAAYGVQKIGMTNLKDRICYSPDFIGSTSTEDPDLDIDDSSEINYKIDKVLDTARRMDLKKIVVRVFHQNKTTKAVLIDEETTVGEACKMLVEKNFCLPKERLTLVEKVPTLKMERFFEDHELLADCILSWPEQSSNMIFFEERPDKYGLFEDPVNWIGEGYVCTKGPLDQAAIQDIFGGTEPTLPDWKDYLYIKKPGEKTWTRRYCVVRSSGLYASRKKKSTTPNDLLRIMVFDPNFHLYTTTGGWTKLRAPTPYGFAVKPYSAQDKSSKTIFYFCASDENAMRRWCASLRIACHGQQLLLNYESAMIRCGREISPEVSTLSRRSREINKNMMASSRKGSLDVLQSSMGSMSSVMSGLSTSRSATMDRQYSRNRHNSLTKLSPFSPLISHLSRPFGGSKSSIASQPTK